MKPFDNADYLGILPVAVPIKKTLSTEISEKSSDNDNKTKTKSIGSINVANTEIICQQLYQ